jgi:hypothetical protein
MAFNGGLKLKKTLGLKRAQLNVDTSKKDKNATLRRGIFVFSC